MSHKDGVMPISKPEKRPKSHKGLSRSSQMERKPSKLRKSPLGHASAEQKAKVEREGPRLDWTVRFSPELHVLILERLPYGVTTLGSTDPAHITPRTQGGCDSEHCICPLPRVLHDLYDEGKLDLLPWLTLEEQSHAVKHLGILGALKRTTGENYIPERREVAA